MKANLIIRGTVSIWFLLAIAACTPVAEKTVQTLQQGTPASPPSICDLPLYTDRNASTLIMDTQNSYLHIRAYRGGRLARFGHNHIISAHALKGHIVYEDEPTSSVFVLCIPVASLEVDNPILRKAAGERFTSTLDEAAIQATRNNMLGERLLDGEHYPWIVVRGKVEAIQEEFSVLQLAIQLRKHQSLHQQTSKVAIEGDVLSTEGHLTLSQQALGLTPYSALFGALQVKDELDIHYHLVANKE